MKISRTLITLILCLLLSLLPITLCACNNFYSVEFTCFNTDAYITVNKSISDDVKNQLGDLLAEIERTVKEDLTAVNNAEKDATTTISQHTLYLFEKSKEGFALSNKKFNPAVKPLLDLWKLSSDTFNSHLKNYTPPSDAEISQLLPYCDFEKVNLSDNTIIKEQTEIKLDFGAIIKGYAVDKIKDVLIANGYTDGYINLGGSSIYVLDFKDGLSIRHPRKTGENIIKVNADIIKNSPLSTSGDYVKAYIDENGNRYSHFIDAAVGKPSTTGFSSITVIANGNTNNKTALFTDMVSTALMLMQTDELVSFITNQLNGFTVFAVSEDHKIITNADKKDFTLIDADYQINYI